MRAFAFALAISLGWAQATRAAPPARVASLNLCTDELLLALAAPGQISSLTHLSQDRRESAYWRMAQPHRANNGSILSVAQDRPDLIVTMGGGGRDSAGLAQALGARFLDLPFPARLSNVEQGIRLLAGALGRQASGQNLIADIRRVVASTPHRQRPAIFVGSAGRSMAPTGAGAEWLAAAGYRQLPLDGDRIDRETLLRLPALTLVASDYRTDQYSRSDTVPVCRARDGRVTTDGRRWTCMGPSLIPEIRRLRRSAAQ
jgi:iron complex transport system substrate-binding protein